jgi:hypothetical protein
VSPSVQVVQTEKTIFKNTPPYQRFVLSIDRGSIALDSQSESTCRLLPRASATAMHNGTGVPRKLFLKNAKHHELFPQEHSAVARW